MYNCVHVHIIVKCLPEQSMLPRECKNVYQYCALHVSSFTHRNVCARLHKEVLVK